MIDFWSIIKLDFLYYNNVHKKYVFSDLFEQNRSRVGEILSQSRQGQLFFSS